MATRVWEYLDEWRAEKEDILAAVTSVFESGQLVLGPAVAEFEEKFGAYHEGRACIGVDNGTNAVQLALEAVGVGEGHEVITVSNTAAPTVIAIVGAGATPVFVDVDPETYLMDVAAVEARVTERTKAILPVHLFGQCVDMRQIRAIADRHGLAIVEDCAQAHGARQNGQLAGTFGDVAAYSFYPTKVLGAYGDGGAVLAKSPEHEKVLRQIRYYGMEQAYYVVRTPGHNSRLDAVQAAILTTKLARLDEYTKARRTIADRYVHGLGDLSTLGLTLPTTAPGNEHVYYVFVVRHPERDKIMQRLRDDFDINLNISYPWPCHTMSGFEHLGWDAVDLPVTDRLATEIFSLPMYPSLALAEQERVISAVRQVVAELQR